MGRGIYYFNVRKEGSKEDGKKGEKQAAREGRTFPTPLSREDIIAANILLFSS